MGCWQWSAALLLARRTQRRVVTKTHKRPQLLQLRRRVKGHSVIVPLQECVHRAPRSAGTRTSPASSCLVTTFCCDSAWRTRNTRLTLLDMDDGCCFAVCQGCEYVPRCYGKRYGTRLHTRVDS
eukprot:6438072-Prymnesium_polylepis.2